MKRAKVFKCSYCGAPHVFGASTSPLVRSGVWVSGDEKNDNEVTSCDSCSSICRDEDGLICFDMQALTNSLAAVGASIIFDNPEDPEASRFVIRFEEEPSEATVEKAKQITSRALRNVSYGKLENAEA